MFPVSICLISKNEELNIEKCLQSVKGCELPIILCDTGSTDQTVDIARKYTQNIFYFKWINDFSAARNFCASKANTDWIWMIDCDEFLSVDPPNVESNLSCLVSSILKPLISDSSNLHKIGTILRKDAYPLQGIITYANSRMGRIYNRNFYHYSGKIHEQISPLSEEVSCSYLDLPLHFEHSGYDSIETLEKKCKRNISLLEKELQIQKDPYILYQLGKAYSALGKTDTAITYYQEGLSFDLDPSLYYVKSMVQDYGYCLLDQKRYKEALSFEEIYDAFAINSDFIFLMALIYMNNAHFNEAIREFKKATTFPESIVDGVNSYLAFYNIGVILECMGKIQEAIPFYQKCGSYPPALKRLEVLCNA